PAIRQKEAWIFCLRKAFSLWLVWRNRSRTALRPAPSHLQAVRVTIADEPTSRRPGKVGTNNQRWRIGITGHESLAGAVGLDRVGVSRRAPIRVGELAGMMHEIPSNDGFLTV